MFELIHICSQGDLCIRHRHQKIHNLSSLLEKSTSDFHSVRTISDLSHLSKGRKRVSTHGSGVNGLERTITSPRRPRYLVSPLRAHSPQRDVHRRLLAFDHHRIARSILSGGFTLGLARKVAELIGKMRRCSVHSRRFTWTTSPADTITLSADHVCVNLLVDYIPPSLRRASRTLSFLVSIQVTISMELSRETHLLQKSDSKAFALNQS